MDDSTSNAAAAGFAVVIVLIYVVVFVALFGFMIWCYWKIAAKAGYNPALSLLMLVPVANLIVIGMFAFQRWPIEDALALAQGGSPAPAPGTTVMPQ